MNMMLMIKALNGASLDMDCNGTRVTCGPFSRIVELRGSMMTHAAPNLEQRVVVEDTRGLM